MKTQNFSHSRYGRKDATSDKAAADKAAADLAAKTAPTTGTENELTVKQVEDLVTKAVTAALAASKTTDTKSVTEDAIRKIIKDELAAQGNDSKALTSDQIAQAAAAASTKAVEEAGRKSAVNIREGADATGRRQVEIPYSWTKGNLPLHGKQLLNILTNPNLPAQQIINKGIDQSDIDRGIALGERAIQRMRAGAKAIMTIADAGAGAEFEPHELSSELQRRLFLASDLAALIGAREIDMPSQPYDYPLVTTRPVFYLESTEGSGTTASTPGTGKITLDAKKLMAKVSYSYEINEDSIVPILSTIQTLLAEAAAAAYESCVINGDTTATHMDSDTNTNAKAPERAFMGLRKLALAGTTATTLDLSTGGLNEANLRALRKLMGKYGLKTSDLAWVCGPAGKNDLEGITNVSTMEKFGPRATVVTGELSAFLGIPIIGSEQCRENLNASGVFDNSTKTKGSIILVNLSRFIGGRRREFTIESFRDIKLQQNDIVASFRKDFKPVETPSATVPSVALGYNYTA